MLLTAVALAGAIGGCGADDELSTDIPRTSPDLTIPTATTEIEPSQSTTDTTSTTSTTGATPSSPPAAATPPAPTPPAPVTPPAPAPPASTTGGAAPPSGQPTTGGAQADPEFQNFCRDNPGAGPPC